MQDLKEKRIAAYARYFTDRQNMDMFLIGRSVADNDRLLEELIRGGARFITVYGVG